MPLLANIDPAEISLEQDYALKGMGKHASPYARHFKNLRTNEHYAEISRLPFCDYLGRPLSCVFSRITGGYLANQVYSIFISDDGELTISYLNDQPGGIKANQIARFNPTLRLGTKNIKPGLAVLMDDDPLNPLYYRNVIEWDYGICTRRVRMVEGSYQGSWIYPSNPGNTVTITYNQSGNVPVKLGKYAIDWDTERIPKEVFDNAVYPFIVRDTLTVYPDAHAESTTVDGMAAHEGTNLTWAAIQGGAGTGAVDNSTGEAIGIFAGDTSSRWNGLYRVLALYNTSALTAAATISAATESFRYSFKDDTNGRTPDSNICASAPASNTAVAAGDYDSLGTTAFATAITYANHLTDGSYTDYTLNAAGLASISKTSITKHGLRNFNYDAANSAPTWTSEEAMYFVPYFAEQGAGYQPKLVVTYTTVVAPTITISAASSVTDTTATLNGNVTVTGGENPTVTTYWGNNDALQVAGDWDNNSAPTSPGQPQGVAAFTKDVTGLTTNTRYWFSAKATNSAGTGWPAASLNFPTLNTAAYLYLRSIDDRNETGNPTNLRLGSQASKPYLLFLLSLADGFKGGDTRTESMAAGVAVTDGLNSGDTNSELGAFASLIADGLKIGDASIVELIAAIVYELALIDALNVGDNTTASMLATLLSSDGLKAGDTTIQLANMTPSVTDGVSHGDSLAVNILSSLSITDSIKLGDSLAALVAMGLNLADGIKPGDNSYINMLAALIAADGIKIGDSALASFIGSLTLSDGIKLSDTTLSALASSLTINDGLKSGDAAQLLASLNTTLSDGIKLGDALLHELTGIIYALAITEGLKAGDTLILSFLSNLTLSDGVKLGDAVHSYIAGVIRIIVNNARKSSNIGLPDRSQNVSHTDTNQNQSFPDRSQSQSSSDRSQNNQTYTE